MASSMNQIYLSVCNSVSQPFLTLVSSVVMSSSLASLINILCKKDKRKWSVLFLFIYLNKNKVSTLSMATSVIDFSISIEVLETQVEKRCSRNIIGLSSFFFFPFTNFWECWRLVSDAIFKNVRLFLNCLVRSCVVFRIYHFLAHFSN